MPSKEQAHNNDKSSSGQQGSQPKEQKIATQHQLASQIVQKSRLTPQLLIPRDLLQIQRAIGNRAVGRLLNPGKQRQSFQEEENNTGLPDNLKSGIENLSGYSMDDVKVHYNSDKPAQLQAHAYAYGTDIHLASGQEKHLPHEAWHVVQQKQGYVEPTMQMKGSVNLNDDQDLEREADIMGIKALNVTDNISKLLSPPANKVYQLVKFEKEQTGDYGDVETDDEEDVFGFLESYQSKDLDNDKIDSTIWDEIKKALKSGKYSDKRNSIIEILVSTGIASHEELGTGFESKELSEKERLWREKAKKDTGGWFVDVETSKMGKLEFLNEVLQIARSIIPRAFNKQEEVGKVKKDYTNTAYNCKDALVRAYAEDLQKKGVLVRNNYIHPAALERMYAIIRSTKPEEVEMAYITGVCKDFASICYGLILQNDVSNTLKPKLALMHGHVYVEVTIGDEQYAVDAWFGGKVKPKAEHEQDVSKKHKGVKKAEQSDLFTGREYQTSLEESYEKAELARLIWYENEDRYRKIAEEVWKKGETTNVNRGSL